MELDQIFSKVEINVINDMCLYWLEKYFEYHEPLACDSDIIHHTEITMQESYFQTKFKNIDISDLFDKLVEYKFGKIQEEEMCGLVIKDPGEIDMQIKDRKCFERFFTWDKKVFYPIINKLLQDLQK